MVYNIDLSTDETKRLKLGKRKEKDVTTFAFDISTWVEEFGAGGDAFMTVLRPDEETPYPEPLEIDGGTATWVVSESDTFLEGKGFAQLSYVVDGKIKKTIQFKTVVEKSITAGDTEPPDQYEDWLDHLTVLYAQDISNWLDEHPEATTTVQDGSIGKAKFTRSLNKEFDRKMSRGDIVQLSLQEEKVISFSSFNAGIPATYAPQGACYNSDTEQFVFLFSNITDWSQDSLIVVTDSSFSKVSEHYAQLWHANDITYNPVADQYVVAPSHADGEILVLDYLFNVVQTVIVDGLPPERVLQVAYDETDGGYFLTTGDTRETYKVNSDFEDPQLFAVQTLSRFTENTYSNIYMFDIQGCDAHNGELISLAWFWRSGAETNGITRLGVFHDGDEDCYYKMDHPHSLWNEPEAVCIVDDGGYVFSYYDSNLVIRRLFINSSLSEIATDTSWEYYEIPSMTAWQEYSKTIHLKAGKYLVDVYTNTISYANSQQAFRLVVTWGTGDFYSNTVLTYSGVPSQANLTKIIDIKKDIDVTVSLMSDKAYSAKTLYVNIRILYLQNS